MEVGSLKAAQAALDGKKLEDDERLILAALRQAGYDEDERPRGHAGVLSSNALARAIFSGLSELDGLSAAEKAYRMESCKRRVRTAVNRLIIVHGVPIMCRAGTGGGYYLPATTADVEENHGAFHKRAMTGLIKASRGRKAAYADAMVQLTLGFESEAEAYREMVTGTSAPAEVGPPAWVSVVSGLLQQVKGDPARYAAEIKRIQDEFGDIFVRRERLRESLRRRNCVADEGGRMKASIFEVMESVQSELDYQDQCWPGHTHSVGEWILIMDKCMTDAKRAYVTGHGDDKALHENPTGHSHWDRGNERVRSE